MSEADKVSSCLKVAWLRPFVRISRVVKILTLGGFAAGYFVFVGTSSVAGPVPQAPEMITVPAGEFEMGGDHDDWAAPDERGNRVLQLSAFAASKTEVTALQYNTCVRAGGCRAAAIKAKEDDAPVTGVSWRDAQSYAAWLSAQTGFRYRLLSEAEWERLARAGTQSRFWWGSVSDYAFGNFGDEDCCHVAIKGPDVFETTAPVRRFEPTPEGFYDLYGNVWEWTQDCYGNYDHDVHDGSAQDPANCTVRVVRGGSYLLSAGFARASARYRLTPGARRPDLGFRMAMDLDKP